MNKNIIFYFFLSGFFLLCNISISQNLQSQPDNTDKQILYNGKEWRNAYTAVKGDQFLFSRDFLPASLTINNKTFIGVGINYDIYNDELVIPTQRGVNIQLNKEMVDSFTLQFEDKKFKFLNTHDSITGTKGYVNVLYEGPTSLYIKYRKEIQLLAVDDKYDLFFQTSKVFVLKDGDVHQMSGKNDLLKLLEKNKSQLKDFMKKNRLKVSKKTPESFIPVLRYYDSLSN